MARALRIEHPGAFYHVLNRGQRREAIVQDQQDRERDVAIYLARELAGLPGRELGRCFGGLKGAGIAMRCTHVLGRLAEDRRLSKDIAQLRRKITNNE